MKRYAALAAVVWLFVDLWPRVPLTVWLWAGTGSGLVVYLVLAVIAYRLAAEAAADENNY